jgi:predicted kinase
MMGRPKHGKTTFARKAAAELKVPLVSYRDLFQALTGGIVVDEFNVRLNQVVLDTIGWYLLKGKTVIYDAGNMTRASRQPLMEMAQVLEIPVHGIWCVCDAATQKERLLSAGFPLEQAELINRVWEAPNMDEGYEEIVVQFTDASALSEVKLVHDGDLGKA